MMKYMQQCEKKVASAFDTKVYACRLHLNRYLRERKKICLVSNGNNFTTVGPGWHARPTIYNKTLVYWHGFLQVKVIELMTNKKLDLTLALITIGNRKSFSMKLCTKCFLWVGFRSEIHWIVYILLHKVFFAIVGSKKPNNNTWHLIDP